MKRQVKVSTGRSVGYSMSESVGEGSASVSTTTTPGTGLLDLFPTAAVAYSPARRLRDAYAGPLVKVRRSSDNAEQDFGFVAATGVLDTASLSAFCGAGDGLVVTLYDQSGNARDAVQATATRQPVLFSAGALVTMGTNSRPALRVTRAAVQFVQATAFSPGTSLSSASMFAALARSDEAAFSILVSFGNAAAAGDNGSFALQGPTSIGATNVGFRARGASAPAALEMGSITVSTPHVFAAATIFTNTGAQGYRMLRDGVNATLTSSASLSGGVLGSYPFAIGAAGNGSSPSSSVLGDVVFYPTSARASASSGVDANIKTFWGIT